MTDIRKLANALTAMAIAKSYANTAYAQNAKPYPKPLYKKQLSSMKQPSGL